MFSNKIRQSELFVVIGRVGSSDCRAVPVIPSLIPIWANLLYWPESLDHENVPAAFQLLSYRHFPLITWPTFLTESDVIRQTQSIHLLTPPVEIIFIILCSTFSLNCWNVKMSCHSRITLSLRRYDAISLHGNLL